MRASSLAILLLLVTGCRHFEYAGPHGEKVVSDSFGNKSSIGDFEIKPTGEAHMHNYNNDQVQGLEAVVSAAVKGALQGVKP